VVRGDVFEAEALREFEGDLLDESAGVDEDQRAAVMVSERGELVEYLSPHGGGGDGGELVGRDFDGEIKRAALADLHDLCRLARGVRAGEEVGDELDGILRGGEADALRRGLEADQHAAGSEVVFAADEGFEALEREGEMGATLVVRDGVDLVDDDGADAAEILTRLAGGEQDVE
jgi:hypothetical protein